MLTWAKQIANLQKTLIANVDSSNAFLQQRSPTSSDCPQLTDFADRSKDIYNQILKLSRPEEARSVHNEFVDSYSKSADADRFYAISICQDDVTYYDKYASALVDANRTNEAAFHDFKQLMDKYSISCDDVDLCEDSVLPTPAKYVSITKLVPTQDPCFRWGQITPTMIGQTVCVYGNVYKTRFVGNNTFQILFSENPKDFFLAGGSYNYTVKSGECVRAEGTILRSGSGVPYIDIDNALYYCP